MDLNFLVFPAPSTKWNAEDLSMVYIPDIDRSWSKVEIPEHQKAKYIKGDTGRLHKKSLIINDDDFLLNNNICNENTSENLKENVPYNHYRGLNESEDDMQDSICNNSNFQELKIQIIDKESIIKAKNEQELFNRNMSVENFKKRHIISYIPCQYLPSSLKPRKFMLFFHGNDEDIFFCKNFCQYLCDKLNINVIAMEYPGYGIYMGEPNEETIFKNAKAIYDFLTIDLKISSLDIIQFGRSQGSGPAVWLASEECVCATILMSPFTSIKAVAEDKVGKFWANILKNKFDNQSRIESLKCPVIFLNGMKDEMVPWKHSQELFEKVKTKTELISEYQKFENMDYITFEHDSHITKRIMDFLERTNYKVKDRRIFEMPKFLLKKPEIFKFRD